MLLSSSSLKPNYLSLWNSLSSKIRNFTTLDSYKLCIRTHLFSLAFTPWCWVKVLFCFVVCVWSDLGFLQRCYIKGSYSHNYYLDSQLVKRQNVAGVFNYPLIHYSWHCLYLIVCETHQVVPRTRLEPSGGGSWGHAHLPLELLQSSLLPLPPCRSWETQTLSAGISREFNFKR